MKASSGNKDRNVVLLDASYIASIHTKLSFSAFLAALCISCLLHYKKVVKNEVAGYPQEWIPSVSATIGDWYPERNIFQLLVALTSGFRFALIGLQYHLMYSPTSSLPTLLALCGILRTLTCGGWVYITSNDDHDAHDVLMILYIVLNVPWMFGGIALTPRTRTAVRFRRVAITFVFFTSIIPMAYFFVQHKVYRVPGAYTHYSVFEWALIFLDILYDSVAEKDVKDSKLQIAVGSHLRDTRGKIDIPEEDQVAIETAEGKTIDRFTKREIGSKPSSDGSASASRIVEPSTWSWRPFISFTSDAYLAFIAWSIFTSLTPSLFYFSVWELGIAGHELALLSTLAPILLSHPAVLSWARAKSGLITLHLISFLGLLAYATDSPVYRLLLVTLATAAVTLRQAVEWSSGAHTRYDSGYHGILLGLSVIVSSLLKLANHSNNPVWPFVNEASGGYNKMGLCLASLALLEFGTRPPSEPKPLRPASGLEIKSKKGWVSSAVALGSLIFSLHSLLSDSSTLIAWSWTGFANGQPNGPTPALHSSLTLLSQAAGLLMAAIMASPLAAGSSVLTHPVWFSCGSAAAYVLYTYRNWDGYMGGIFLAFFLMSITPNLVHRAAQSGPPGKVFFVAWLVVCLFDLAHVWTVAYAFVPGGVYLRERTDLVLIAQFAALAPTFAWPRRNLTLSNKTKSYAWSTLATLSVLSLLASLYHLPTAPPRPHKPGARIITAGIWTVHFGIDQEGRDSQRRIRNLVRDMQLDVVGLLETDLHRVVFGNRDLTRVLAEDLGFYVDPGPGPNSHTWGAVLLSKFPIIKSTHHLLPSPHGELAPAIEAILDVYGTSVGVVVAHNGQEEDLLDRELQSRELARIMAALDPLPVIFLGYLVTAPLAPQPAPYDILVSDGRMHDIDNTDSDRWCEYILYRGLYRTVYARVSHGGITDTELQLGRFVVPKHGFSITNDTTEARYLRSPKEDVPEDYWFPMEYYPSHGGKNGHVYHVFNAPLYYKIPDDAVL